MNKNIKYVVLAVAAVFAVAMPELAMAAFDPAAATTDADGKGWVETAAQWMLGIAVAIYCMRRVIGFFSK